MSPGRASAACAAPVDRKVRERMRLATLIPGSRAVPVSGGPTSRLETALRCGVTVSCCGQDEPFAAGVATEAPVTPTWLSRQPHADVFSNAGVTGAEPQAERPR
jgi:hypothetical protein